MTTITIDLELTADDFADIVDAACMAIGYWARNTEFIEPYNENDPPSTLTVVCDEGRIHLLTAPLIEEAMSKIVENKIEVSNSTRNDVTRSIKENDMSYIDANAADAIIQVACFGEIVYG